MKKNSFDFVITAAGILLLGIGLFLVKTLSDPQGGMLALPYVCIGVGCGIFGHGMGNLISRKVYRKNPAVQKQMEVDQNDERNIAISNRAKAKAYDMMVFVFGALMVTFALMGVDLIPVLMLVLSYLVVIGYGIYYRCKYDKEM